MVYIILAVIAAFAVYAFIENKLLLRVRREELGGNIKAVHLSDLHKRVSGRIIRVSAKPLRGSHRTS